jgi:hypothetical protein
MIKVNHSDEEYGMANFGKDSQWNDPYQGMRPESDPKATIGWDIATAEYSCFYIHQIKVWTAWSVNQEDISYTIDSPYYLNAERFADV